ncbi:YqcI/YcgG family protein [Bacillus pseudomycoides]|nr:YqcI/YcgG family protein [Bacillus pseudomycoides]
MLYNQKDAFLSTSSKQIWLKNSLSKTHEVIKKENFPCTFGVQGYMKELHYVSALNFPYSAEELANDIKNYLAAIKNLNSTEKGLSGLLVYFEPIEEMSIHSLQMIAWNALEGVKKFDEYQWPKGISKDPESMDYAFCFQNELWFINFSSSKYVNRKSRNLGNTITLAMQAFSASDEFFKRDNVLKANAQKLVRKRAEKFDGCPVHSGLGPIIGEEKPAPLKLSYFIGDTNNEKSFEPWKYEYIAPSHYIIDSNIFEGRDKVEINMLLKKIEDLNGQITIYSEQQLEESEMEFEVIDNLENVKGKLNTILVSKSYQTLLSFKDEYTYTCMLEGDLVSEELRKSVDFVIHTFADLMGLYRIKSLETCGNRN